MNIIYLGTDVFFSTFQYFIKNHRVLALYTYNNKEDYFTERNVVQLAHSSHVPVHYERITKDAMEKHIRDEGCELFFSAEYCYKIPLPENSPGFRGVNAHNSLLPIGKGYCPVECAMERKIAWTGVTIHKLAERIDTGDILMQKGFPARDEDDSVDLYLKCGYALREMAAVLLSNFNYYWENGEKQAKKGIYWYRPEESKVVITHEMTVEDAARIYHCFNKLSKLFFYGKEYYIDSFMTGNTRIGNRDEDVIALKDNRIIFGLKDGNIRVDLTDAGEQQE